MIFRTASIRLPGRSGAALVVVLAMLVLAVGVAVALLNLAKTERQSAAVFLTNSETRQLGDTAVGIVQSQINHATSRGASVAWASQPGMIRTYKSDGTMDTAFKLYSAVTMTESDPAALGADLPPAGWASLPAVWTDLNAPVKVEDRSVFPVLDPGILDLSPASQPLGFSIGNAPGATADQRAPMPVRWLYVLEDGQIVAASGSANTISVAGVSQKNPIVGRVAFWTDDESCKVNVNTAGVGGYWDTPHFYTTEERKFATSQPLNGEYQRYPGHPATTSLSAVFPDLTDTQILSLVTPRYQWGGSQQGAADTYLMKQALNSGTLANAPLYASTDDIAFLASYTARQQNSLFSRDVIERSRFFLTADSRAPEINLFNLPRISCWPISVNSQGRTTFDKVIAFASSIGSHPYYFQRQSALSPTTDSSIPRNQQIFSYLQYLTSQTFPGFGVSLAGKFGGDRDQILTEIWDYIRCTNLYDSRLAAGNQFTASNNGISSGYGYVVPLENGTSRGMGRSITLSELAFVFVCTADPVDTQFSGTKGMKDSNDPSTNRTLQGTKLNPSERRIQMMIVPEFFSPSQGEVSIRPKFIRLSIQGLTAFTLDGKTLFASNPQPLKLDDVFFNSGFHRRFIGGAFDYRSALGGYAGGMKPAVDPGVLDSGAPAFPFISKFVTITVPNPGTASPGTMPFATGPLTVLIETSVDGSTWTTSQTISITPPASSNIPIPNLVRLATPVSANAPETDVGHWWAFSNSSPTGGTFGGRLTTLSRDPGSYSMPGGIPMASGAGSVLGGTLFREAEDATYYTDVVRSVAVAHGDLRLVEGLKTVPAEAFAAVGNWNATGAANALIHTLSAGAQNARLVPGGSQFRRHFVTATPIGLDTNPGAGGYLPPDFPTSASNAVLSAVAASGDFDNGTAYWPDGPYINKPDEGNVYNQGTSGVAGASKPYFESTEQALVLSAGFFSPNRVTPGPGMFGSLPTHVKRYASNPSKPEDAAWRTLLFRKQPSHPDSVSASGGGIPSGAAPDHLLMDLFWMPAVEPYAISEPFSTAGKVNMNYQMQPFTYINRKTALYAVLQREKLAAVQNSDASKYKVSANASFPQTGNASLDSVRLSLDAAATLAQFDTRFADASGRLFLSPSELCDLWLVPAGESVGSMGSFWSNHSITGDNMRERPYTTIIPRLTTKSNTFTVHYRVQRLKLPLGVSAGTWDESKGAITGEYRGSTTIQRFIDLNDQTLLNTDFTVDTASQPTLDAFYRWRVLGNRQFAP